MPRNAQDVTNAELAILQKLWDGKGSSVRGLAETLYGEASTSATATVQKLLGRLESKGHVRRDREVWPHHFTAVTAREQLISQRLQSTADELCEGSLGPLLTHLVSSDALSAEQRDRLRRLLDELDA